MNLYTIKNGRLTLHLHKGQSRAWRSERRFVVVLAGTQSGKTSFGPLWLWREIQKRGAGDYMVVTPTYTLLEVKALPEFLRFFERTLNLGKYLASPRRRFVLSPEGERRLFGAEQNTPTNIFFGYATDSDSLESATLKAVWLDEAGQRKFHRQSWEALQRRLSLYTGRALVTTTPYDLGWLKTEFYDRRESDPNVELIRFDSTENPAFPIAEFERARNALPAWKFDLFYRAIFTRPAGLIYDAFDEVRHTVKRFEIPVNWKRFVGLDFGGVNTAAVFYAEEPITKKLYLYREYRAGGLTAAEHAKAILTGEPKFALVVGGSASENQWRAEFRAAGLLVRAPGTPSVEIGIDRVYGAHKRDEILVFDDLRGYLEEKRTYSRTLDLAGEPTAEIEDKHAFHLLDAERYIIGSLRGASNKFVSW